VFAGMAKPLLRDLFTSEFVHGDDGMGNMGLPDPATVAAAVYPDTVLDTVDAYTYVETRSETTYGQVIMDTCTCSGGTPMRRSAAHSTGGASKSDYSMPSSNASGVSSLNRDQADHALDQHPLVIHRAATGDESGFASRA
jgi:hypothetical protein